DAWSRSPLAAVYGKSEKRGWSIEKESEKRLKSLKSADAKIAAAAEVDALMKTDPRRLASMDAQMVALEEKAALADLPALKFAPVHSGEDGAAPHSATSAVQYALEALGWIEFVNGPDNDYGPSTIDAVKKLQAAKGYDETRWLSNRQIRDTVCEAAKKASDPVSMLNISMMYANGWGFKKDINKARAAIAQAGATMSTQLSGLEELPSWKQDHYPQFASQIELQQAAIETAWSALPAHERADVDPADLCR
ncbi:MAG: hypothetical protein AAGJ87_16225, partial [Pseudomonadota bacterium]